MTTPWGVPAQHYNNLTPAEAERLAMLAEECGEVVQMVGKILRHGYEECHPNDQHQQTNRSLLSSELIDLLAVVDLMENRGDLPLRPTAADYGKAVRRKLRYAHHQEPQ